MCTSLSHPLLAGKTKRAAEVTDEDKSQQPILKKFHQDDEGYQEDPSNKENKKCEAHEDNKDLLRKSSQRAFGKQQYQLALHHYEEKNYVQYIECLQIAADNEYANAQYCLADVYSQTNMLGPRNFYKAFELYKKAALGSQLGNAYYQVALFYLGADNVVEKNVKKAVKWLTKAVKLRCQPAASMLREYIWEEALEKCRKAAQKESKIDQYNLGYWLEIGNPQDRTAAIIWYKHAARNGHIPSYQRLASLYRFGQGVSKNLNEAFEWYCAAAEYKSRWALTLFEHIGIEYKIGKGFALNKKEAFNRFKEKIEQYDEGMPSADALGAGEL